MTPPSHRARYDENGDIVLPELEEKIVIEKIVPAPVEEIQKPVVKRTPKQKPPRTAEWKAVYGGMRVAASSLVAEGRSQYTWSAQSIFDTAQELGLELRKSLLRTREFLLQPVWIPGKRKAPKQRSRMSLFCSDVLRFGATFAALFAALFIFLNFSSIWSITAAYIDPLSAAQAAEKLSKAIEAPATTNTTRQAGDLLSMLPAVGPPENRLIIPKLNLNVPIVIPPTDALLNEDWAKLEQDIQHSLQDGVVHYPGTARPGQAGNSFITGHSSYYPGLPGNFKSVFARLPELEIGDEYVVYYGGDKHRYRVMEKKEVKPSDVSVLDQPSGKREGTLMTCTPIGTTLRRLIIKSEEVDPITGELLDVGEHMVKPEAPAVKMEMLPI